MSYFHHLSDEYDTVDWTTVWDVDYGSIPNAFRFCFSLALSVPSCNGSKRSFFSKYLLFAIYHVYKVYVEEKE
jgi:hypothetical protein